MAGKKNFGFEIQGGRQIDLDLADTSLANELTEVIGAWSSCISCGSCTATCPAGINFRKLHYQIRLTTLNWLDQVPESLKGQATNSGLSALNRLAPELSKKAKERLPVETDNYPSLRSCLLCGKCQLVCPRGIPTRYLAIQIMQKTRHHAEGIPSV